LNIVRNIIKVIRQYRALWNRISFNGQQAHYNAMGEEAYSFIHIESMVGKGKNEVKKE
jgi:hypothetical protein